MTKKASYIVNINGKTQQESNIKKVNQVVSNAIKTNAEVQVFESRPPAKQPVRIF